MAMSAGAACEYALGVPELVAFAPSPNFAPLVEEEAPAVLLRAPNRVGKTRHMAWLAATRAVEDPGARIRVVSPTNKHAQTVMGAYLADFLAPWLHPKSYYVRGRGWNGGRAYEILLANGAVIELRSLEDAPIAHSGSALDLVLMDEPPKRAHLLENRARLMDRQGQMIIGATMVGRPVAWLREMVEGEEASPKEGRTEHASGWVQYVAKLDREHCPWYTEAQIRRWIEQVSSSPWELAQRVYGAWEGLSLDRLFTGFSERCVSDALPTHPVHIGCSFDHGQRPGAQVGIVALWEHDGPAGRPRVWVAAEYVSTTRTTATGDAREMLRRFKKLGIRAVSVDVAVGDVNTRKGGWALNEDLEKAFAEETGRQHPPFRIETPAKAPGDMAWGLRMINAALDRGELTIHPRCERLLYSLRHWRGGKTGEDGELKHLVDALRYLLTHDEVLGRQHGYAALRF